MTTVIPIAGNGTRMYPLGVTTPKALLEIANKPQMIWQLENLLQAGIDRVIYIVSAGAFGQVLQDFITKIPDRYAHLATIKIQIAVQKQQLGTAHVLQQARELLTQTEVFLFLYGDDLYGPETIQQVIKTPTLSVAGQEVADPEKWGIFSTNDHGNLDQVVEKPTEYVGNLANIGCMKLSNRIFELYGQIQISPRGELEVTDSLRLLAQETPIKVVPVADYWLPLGYPWHILEATDQITDTMETNIKGKVEEGVIIDGTVVLPASSKIKAGTRVEGKLVVGENCIIGPHAYLRGYNTIGDNTNVGFGAELKNVVIGHHSHLAHRCYVGDSIIGNQVNIAAGTSVANWRHDASIIKTVIKDKLIETGLEKFGTVLGDNVKLGINTSIYPGRKIWPGKTTRPGQVVDRDIVE